MATIVNSRDLKLQATSPRFIPVRPQGIYLVESSDNFIVAEDGSARPADGIVYSLDIVGVTYTASPVFTVTSGTATLTDVLEGEPLAANPNKKKLLFEGMLSEAITVTASLTDSTGAVFTSSIRTRKIREVSTGVAISTQSGLFRVDGSGVGSPAVMEVYVAPKFLEFSSAPVYTLTAVNSSGVTIPGIVLVPDAIKELTWLLDYDEVAASGELSFGVKVSVTDKYSIEHTATALLDVLVAASNFVRLSSSSPFFVKPKTSSTLTPSSITFTAVKQGVVDPVVWSILNQSGGNISFTTGTDSNGNATATVTNSQFAAATLATITATAGTYSDITTVQLVDEAVDGVFVAMANSLHEFDADAVGSIYSFTGSGSSFTIYEGATQVTTYDTGAPYAASSYRFGTPTVVTDSGSLSTPSFSGGVLNSYSSMSANTATVTIPVIVTKQDGTAVTVNVSQTLVKKKRGAVLSLSSTASSFAYTEAGTTPAPTSATITALVSNISPTLTTWYSSITVGAGAESARTTNTGSTKTYTYTPQAAYSNMPQTVTIKVYDAASGGNLIATASIGMGATRVGDKGADGSDAVRIDLTNDSHPIPCNVDGSNPLFTGATTTASIYLGSADDSANWTWVTSTSGVTITGANTRTVTITGISADTGYVDFTASKSGFSSQTARFSVYRAKGGGYSIVPSVNAVQESTNGVFTPASVTFTAQLVKPDGSTSAYNVGRYNISTSTDGASWTSRYTSPSDSASASLTVPTGTTHIRGILYQSGGTSVVLDQETIPVVSDGSNGTDGRTYALAVAGGTRSFTYNAAGTASSPVTSSAFTAVLTLDGATVSPSSYSWSATGRLSGTSTAASFTPAVNQSYVADSTSVTLTVTHGSPAVSTTVTVPVAVAKVGDTGTNAINGILTNENYLIPSLQNGTGYTSYLSSAGGTFKVSFGTTDVTTSSVFNIVGGTDAGTTWTKVQNGLTFTINETTGVYSLSGASWTTDSESFTVTATYGGSTVTKIYTITKAKQGLPGKKTVVVKLFKWDTSAIIPTADSSYNWSTNTLSLGSVTGWSTTVPSSTASGQKLYELSKLLIVDSDYTSTSTVDWNTADAVGPVGVINEIGIRQDGSIGPTGPRGQTGYVYYTLESSTAPTPTPTATTFNFDTGAFTGLSTNWDTTYNVPSPTATTTNEKYWSSRYVVTEATYGGTQTITFSAPFVHTNFDGLVTFTNLNNGTDGTGAGTTFIDGGSIKTNTVKADAILTTSLSAIESNLGTVTVADAGHMRSGKTSSTDTTNAGFFLGYNSPTYTFFIGNAGDTVSLKYDGNLTLKGGTVNVGTTGAVYGGQTAYDTGRGFFLGYSTGTQKLSIGCQSFTVTANPSTDIFTSAAFCALYPNNSAVCISNLGSTSGLRQGRWYYVINNNGTTFQLATTQGGSATAFGGSVSSVVLGGASLTYDGSNIDFNGENITAGRFRTSKNYSGPRVDIIGHSSTIEIWEESADGSTVSDNIRFGAGQAVRASTWDVLTNTTALVELSNSSTIGHQGRTLQVNNNYSGTEGTYTEAAYFYGNKARALRTEGLYAGTTASVSFYNAASGTTSYTVNSSTGVAAHIATTGTSGTSDTLKVENAALGKTASFTSSNVSNSASVVYATTSGSGKVVEAVSNTAANATAVLTNNNANGLALNANGAIAAANNSATISTIKSTNSATSGVALEAAGRVEASKTLRVTGSQAPTSGEGIEIVYASSIGYVQAYNRATSAYTGLYLSGNQVTVNGAGTGAAGKLGIGTAAFGTNAQNVIAIANGVKPDTSPTGVGQIYVEDGALKFRGGSGTVTVLAPA